MILSSLSLLLTMAMRAVGYSADNPRTVLRTSGPSKHALQGAGKASDRLSGTAPRDKLKAVMARPERQPIGQLHNALYVALEITVDNLSGRSCPRKRLARARGGCWDVWPRLYRSRSRPRAGRTGWMGVGGWGRPEDHRHENHN